MSGLTRQQATRTAAIACVLIALAAGTLAYLDTQARAGDVVLASTAVEGLGAVHEAALAPGNSVSYSNALEDNWAAIDLFLHSESRDALPEIAEPLEQSWTAFLVADELWRLAEAGETQPAVRDVYAGRWIADSVPAVSGMLVGEGDEARFDNTGLQAVQALVDFGAEQRLVAAVRVSNSLIELE